LGVAPALLVTAEDDLLRDETLSYARKLQDSGVTVRQHLLQEPTGWPCALYYGVGQDAPWRNTLRDCFTTFFADTATGTASASHRQPVGA